LAKLRISVTAAVLAALSCVSTSMAQTVTNLSIVSGNGQVTTNNPYATGSSPFFAPMYVLATDSRGNPIAGAEVDWAITTGGGSLSSSVGNVTTTVSFTDATGTATARFIGDPIYSVGNPTLPYVQTTISATSGNATTTFYLTKSLTLAGTNNGDYVQTTPPTRGGQYLTNIGPPALQGVSGGRDSIPTIQNVAVFLGPGVPGVSVRMFNPQTSPTVNCVTGPGADPGSVLTGSNGNASCTPVFSGTGNGIFYALIGATVPDPTVTDINQVVSFQRYGPFQLTVSPAAPSTVTIVSGNNQAGTPGQTLGQALVAMVTDGTNPLSGQSVVWSVSPAGAATLSNTTTTTDSNGQVRTAVTVSNAVSGSFQVIAALASNAAIKNTFNVAVTLPVVVTGVQKISGDGQSAQLNAQFANPLVVQVNTSSGPAPASYPVTFSATGPGSISATSANTDSTGRAQVTATAGNIGGTLTVTATAGGFSATFTLTVVPPGPIITPGSFYNGADLQKGAISPCGIATVIASGVAPNTVLPPTSFAPSLYRAPNQSVSVGGIQAPIFNAVTLNGQQQLTFQVPCGVTPGSNVSISVLVGGASGSANTTVLPASPGVFGITMSDGKARALLIRGDGSLVSLENPARRNEPLVALVTGLGSTTASVGTNALPPPGAAAAVLGNVIPGVDNKGALLVSAQLSPDLVGVYQVAFVVPGDSTQGNDIAFSIGVDAPGDVDAQGHQVRRYSAPSLIPVQ